MIGYATFFAIVAGCRTHNLSTQIVKDCDHTANFLHSDLGLSLYKKTSNFGQYLYQLFVRILFKPVPKQALVF